MYRKHEDAERLVKSIYHYDCWLSVMREFGVYDEYDIEEVGRFLDAKVRRAADAMTSHMESIDA